MPNEDYIEIKGIDCITDMTKSIALQVHETEEEFIFCIINKFMGTITDMKISKEEIIRAISLIRIQREASTRYGSMISNDWNTANRQMKELERAYMHGLKDGIEKESERIRANFDIILKNNTKFTQNNTE